MKTKLTLVLAAVIGLLAVTTNTSAQTFIYDGVGRVSIVRYDGGLESRYAYDKNGNITSVRTQVINSVSEDGSTKEDLTLIPNPTSDNAVVVLGELVSGMEIAVKIRDLAGRTLVERTTRCEGDRLSVDVRDLAAGSYIIECRYNGTTRTSTLRVVR